MKKTLDALKGDLKFFTELFVFMLKVIGLYFVVFPIFAAAMLIVFASIIYQSTPQNQAACLEAPQALWLDEENRCQLPK